MSLESSTESLRTLIDEMTTAAIAAYHEVDAAIESGEKERQLAAGRMVDELAQKYRTLRDAQIGDARKKFEMALDRRLTDLRRSAAALVQRVGGARAMRAGRCGRRSVPRAAFAVERPGAGRVADAAKEAHRRRHRGGVLVRQVQRDAHAQHRRDGR